MQPPHPSHLVSTIVAALVGAFALGVLANRVRLPPLVGYMLAGVAIGPFTPGFVGDSGLAGQLAEVGVALLMFGVGLHFSLGDLVAVRRVAVPGALVQIAVSVPAGIGLGLAWGWTVGAGAVLGLAASVASTVVLLRVLEERRALDGEVGRVAIGWLIVQDLVMVLALVLLPALAGGTGGSAGALAGELALAAAKVALFGVLVVVVGRRLVPWLLAAVARTGSRELFTLSLLATALGVAYGSATLFGVSFALGAFFAGVVLSGSDLSHQAAADSLPLRDAFAVLFFVSVGMLFDPAVLVREPLRVAAVLLLVVAVKSLAAIASVLLCRRPLGTALRVAAGLAQVGEFSFILAGLGVGLGVLPPEGSDLILAAALLSITVCPAAFDLAGRLAARLERRPGALARAGRRRGGPLAVDPAPDASGDSEAPRDHAVIVGHGRVGATIAGVLAELELPFVVVELDRRRVEDLRGRGVAAVWGDASAAGVLEAAGIADARLIVVAVPDGFQARRVLDRAREACPGVDAVVRVHSEGELKQMRERRVGLAVLGERELALGMLGYALRALGLRESEASLVVRARQAGGDGAARTSDEVGLSRHVPELRPHAIGDEGGGLGAQTSTTT